MALPAATAVAPAFAEPASAAVPPKADHLAMAVLPGARRRVLTPPPYHPESNLTIPNPVTLKPYSPNSEL